MMKKLPVFISAFILLTLSIHPQLAASTLYFNPDSGVLVKNQHFTVTVGLDSKEERVNAVTADFIYPQYLLEVTSLAVNENILPVVAQKSAGGGTVSISGGNYDPFFGNVPLATVSFRVKGEAGSGSLSFTADSAVVEAGKNQDVLTERRQARLTFGPEAQASYSAVQGQTSYSSRENQADLDRDGKISLFDLDILFSHWGLSDEALDLNNNGKVDIFDLSIFLSRSA